jgi:hypothetical protein
MSIYPRISVWHVPSDLLQVAVAEMGRDGEQGNEGTCLWLGTKKDGAANITHTVFLRGSHIRKGSAQIQIAPELMREVHLVAKEFGLVLVGQIHSHGEQYGVDLSYVDHELGFRIPFFLSVVAPDYGMTWPISWNDCGVHIFERERGFIRVPSKEIAMRLVSSHGYTQTLIVGSDE